MRKLTYEQLCGMNDTELNDWRCGQYEPPDDPVESIYNGLEDGRGYPMDRGRSTLEADERAWAEGRE